MTGTPVLAVLIAVLSAGAACRPAPRQEARRIDSTEVAKRRPGSR
jgi:hypothetical protein